MKTIEIEWMHIREKGSTCIRCTDTGEALEDVVARLTEECEPRGWRISFQETELEFKDISKSNTILINGHLIESILPGAIASESECESCCEIIDEPSTCCRTVEFEGSSYEAIPAFLIRDAVCAIADCCD